MESHLGKSRTVERNPDLCSSCKVIDLEALLPIRERSKDFCVRKIDGTLCERAKGPSEVHIGSVSDVVSRLSYCPCCEFFARVIERHGRKASLNINRMEQDYQCYLSLTKNGSYLRQEGGSRHGAAFYDFQVFDIDVKTPRGESRYLFGNAIQLGSRCVPFSSQKRVPTLVGRERSKLCDPFLLRTWLKLCNDHHPTCRLIDDHPQSGSLRLIDVRSLSLRLLDMWSAGSKRYIALSYVWGKGPHDYKLTKSNLDILMQPGGLSNLPPTLMDAIHLVRELGERYLWVDALCIVQDDPEDQAIQIPRMRAIYYNAYLTVVAACGNDVQAGIAGVTTDRDPQNAVWMSNLALFVVAVTQEPARYGESPEETSKLSTRGWTFQEKLLSRRLLIIMEEQVLWECKCNRWLEDMDLEAATHHFEWNNSTLYNSDGGKKLLSIDNFGLLVSQYTRKELTMPADILNAFSGIMDAIPGDFFWGLPLSRFGSHLLWVAYPVSGPLCDESLKETSGRRYSFLGPTWSWMAWKGRILVAGSHEGFNPLIYCYRRLGSELHCISRPSAFKYSEDRTADVSEQSSRGTRSSAMISSRAMKVASLNLKAHRLYSEECTMDDLGTESIQKLTDSRIVLVASSAYLQVRKEPNSERTFGVYPPDLFRNAASITSFVAIQHQEPVEGDSYLLAVITGSKKYLFLMMLSEDAEGICYREHVVKEIVAFGKQLWSNSRGADMPIRE